MWNQQSDSNVIKSIDISENIEDLRFMYVINKSGSCDIKLDVTKIVPRDLLVFDIDTCDGYRRIYGIIQGDESKVEEIRLNLIHELKENK